MSTLQLDPALIEGYALRLERRAGSVRRGARIVGALLGGVLGAVPLTPLGEFLPVPASFGIATLLLGAAVGALFGHVIGESRALDIRVQAQLVLFQLHGGRSTPEPRTPSIAPPQLLPVRRPVLEAVPAPAARRLEVVPPLSPTVS
jgi:hypothetical protein